VLLNQMLDKNNIQRGNHLKRSRPVIQLDAGGGAQVLGLAMAGLHHVAATAYEPHYGTTLRTERRH